MAGAAALEPPARPSGPTAAPASRSPEVDRAASPGPANVDHDQPIAWEEVESDHDEELDFVALSAVPPPPSADAGRRPQAQQQPGRPEPRPPSGGTRPRDVQPDPHPGPSSSTARPNGSPREAGEAQRSVAERADFARRTSDIRQDPLRREELDRRRPEPRDRDRRGPSPTSSQAGVLYRYQSGQRPGSGNPRKPKKKGNKHIRCEICNITCTGEATFESHIRGGKHKTKERQAKLRARNDLNAHRNLGIAQSQRSRISATPAGQDATPVANGHPQAPSTRYSGPPASSARASPPSAVDSTSSPHAASEKASKDTNRDTPVSADPSVTRETSPPKGEKQSSAISGQHTQPARDTNLSLQSTPAPAPVLGSAKSPIAAQESFASTATPPAPATGQEISSKRLTSKMPSSSRTTSQRELAGTSHGNYLTSSGSEGKRPKRPISDVPPARDTEANKGSRASTGGSASDGKKLVADPSSVVVHDKKRETPLSQDQKVGGDCGGREVSAAVPRPRSVDVAESETCDRNYSKRRRVEDVPANAQNNDLSLGNSERPEPTKVVEPAVETENVISCEAIRRDAHPCNPRQQSGALLRSQPTGVARGLGGTGLRSGRPVELPGLRMRPADLRQPQTAAPNPPAGSTTRASEVSAPSDAGNEAGPFIPFKWLEEPMSHFEWLELRANVFRDGTDVDKLAFKLLQELILSPTLGINLTNLGPLCRALLSALPKQRFISPDKPVEVKYTDLPLALRELDPCYASSDPARDDWERKQSPEHLALCQVRDNIYFTFNSNDDPLMRQGKHRSTYGVRGRIPGLGMEKKIAEGSATPTPVYKDSLHEDALFGRIIGYMNEQEARTEGGQHR